MSILKLKDSRLKPTVLSVTALYVFSAVLYFAPVTIPHKISICVAVLTVASLWLCPWQITAALLFSTLGDHMGSCQGFIGQMGFFLIAHVFYIIYFIDRYFKKVEPDRKLTDKAIGYLSTVILISLAFLVFVFLRIVPSAPAGIIRIGVGVYAVVISSMLITALLQRSSLYALGGVLFVFSDFILAWNRFVEPVPYSDYLILVTYYLAQWLIFIRSTRYRVGPEMRLLRF